MEPFSIILFILGVAFLAGSCFLPEKKQEDKVEDYLNKLAKRELSIEEKENIRYAVDQIISEKTEEVINKTDDYLSKVANEKIMALDEYSKQIMERLDKNNSDAMFLYNMLSETKDELKRTVSDVKKIDFTEKAGDESTGHAISALRQQSNGKQKWDAVANPVIGRKEKNEPAASIQERKQEESFSEIVPETATEVAEQCAASLTEEEAEPKKDYQMEMILKLHRQGKSILDISRELSMGQGEVKLVIDLYST